MSAAASEQANLRYVIELCKAHGGRIAHDLSDPREAAYLEQTLRKHGKTPDRYPALFDAIRHRPERTPLVRVAGQPAPLVDDPQGEFKSSQIIDYVSTTQSAAPVTAGHGTLSRTQPVKSTAMTVQVVRVEGEDYTTLATGDRTAYGLQTMGVQTDPALSEPFKPGGDIYAVMSWQVLLANDEWDLGTETIQWSFNTNGIPGVQAPIKNPQRTQGNLQNVMIGLSRGFNNPGQNSDIDYWFWQGQWDNTTLLVPLQGNMKFAYPISPLSNANPALRFYLARTEGGMSDLIAQQTAKYLPQFTIDPTDNTNLKFTLLAGNQDAGNAINFGRSPWVSDTQTFFTGMVTVTLRGPTGPTSGWATIMSVNNPTVQPPVDGVGYTWPIIYVWHCLVEGTMITMEDGSKRAVETLNSGDVVRSGSGTRTVVATLAQPHTGVVYRLTTSGGSTLVGSGSHPIITPNGAAQLQQLREGLEVCTTRGVETISAIETLEQHDAGLFNLWLDRTEGPPDETYMYAEDILVGDYLVQVRLLDLPEVDPDKFRETLPALMRTDFESHREDEAKRAAATATR
jgi:hypothetical protein